MKRILHIFALILATGTSAYGQFISEVLEYQPAPGQLINSSPWGNPGSAQSIIGGVNGSLCLGAFGGYVIFKFDNLVENHPDNPFGVDFTIFGNATPNWSEPGIVWVMKDENENSYPDDTWYELAGSDYFFSSTLRNYEVSYSNPGGDLAADIPWSDNFGNSGFIFANSVHPQNYYPIHDSFPEINPDSYTLAGTLIKQFLDASNPGFVLAKQHAFGYADNKLRGSTPYTLPDNPYTIEKENSGGDAFDISWAVDASGNYVDLDEIHFVKVQNAVQDNAGWLGEISTEITGAVDVEPNTAINGNLYSLVIKDLPSVILNQTHQLEAFVYYMGRMLPDEKISWQTNRPEASVDEFHLLYVITSGELEITASIENHPEISTMVSTLVDLSSASVSDAESKISINIFPNPVKDFIRVSGIENASLEILNLKGQTLNRFPDFDNQKPIDISKLNAGMYLIRVFDNESLRTLKFIKE